MMFTTATTTTKEVKKAPSTEVATKPGTKYKEEEEEKEEEEKEEGIKKIKADAENPLDCTGWNAALILNQPPTTQWPPSHKNTPHTHTHTDTLTIKSKSIQVHFIKRCHTTLLVA